MNQRATEVPSIAVRDAAFHVLPMRTRFPFKYGIASMTALPHLFVTVRCRIGGREATGISSEGLPPKWFTKDPSTTFAEDLPQMLDTIRQAARIAFEIGQVGSFFEWWQVLDARQTSWATESGVAPLLANLGVSLMERAVIDAFGRCTETAFGDALRANQFGIRLGDVHPALAGAEPCDLLPAPLERIIARHTVGLGDPLTEGDITAPLADGLPYSLESCIAAYGLDHFKVKLCGVLERDVARLRELHALFKRTARPNFRLTLDGNEQFADITAFAEHWQIYRGVPEIRDLLDHVLFVEQPLHRDHALDDSVREALANWPDAPPLIIDESDAAIGSLPRALELGYAGTSHKNCKGIVKGIANACLIERLRRTRRDKTWLLSGEDLANVGPVALLQDLTVMANLGIPHAERNGHHYFRGLSMFPADLQDAVLRDHPDLYRRHDDGFATLRIENGTLAIGSLLRAPFGLGLLPDTIRFQPLDDWLQGQ
jgi:hypothetical protein